MLLLLAGCASVRPAGSFQLKQVPAPPDYAQARYWAALPDKKDMADQLPSRSLHDRQATAKADVFFLHPTTYTGSRGEDAWNGPLNDKKLNKKTDKGTIRHQASIFNGAGRVFAPRYRQAHLHAYFASDTATARQAFELAYSDVRAAFQYYLKHHNQGRPIILAAHSQGTSHAAALMREFFDSKSLQSRLVVAYLVGMPVPNDYFANINACEKPDDTGCFCSWRAWEKAYTPRTFEQEINENKIVVTNPLLWNTSAAYADKSLNKGTLLRRFRNGLRPGIADAQVHHSVLWVNKPQFFFRFLIQFKNYHVADYNLFYANVRENAQLRVTAFETKH